VRAASQPRRRAILRPGPGEKDVENARDDQGCRCTTGRELRESARTSDSGPSRGGARATTGADTGGNARLPSSPGVCGPRVSAVAPSPLPTPPKPDQTLPDLRRRRRERVPPRGGRWCLGSTLSALRGRLGMGERAGDRQGCDRRVGHAGRGSAADADNCVARAYPRMCVAPFVHRRTASGTYTCTASQPPS